MEASRLQTIEILAGDGNLDELTKLLAPGYNQLEIDIALENAIAYSQISTAGYLLSLGAKFSNHEYQGVYYAVHNNELKGLRFAISRGVDINVNNGMLLNTSIETAINTKSVELVKWLLDNGANAKLLTKQSLKLVEDFGSPELKIAINKAL
ncbi:MAG TPA: hypothetical protein VK645_04445 [Chitinophagaceae bacterium]|nr:hypothetical protein [Chitinophagaceae bacterium]